MKQVLSLLPTLLGGCLLSPLLSAQIDNGLVSYLQFEIDATTNPTTEGPDGTLLSGAVAGAPGGLLGNALSLDASLGNQHVNLPLTYGPGTALGQNFSISVWYQLNENPANNGSSRYFVFEGDTNFEVSYGLRDLGLGEPGPNDGQAFTGGGTNVAIADAGLPGWQHVLQTYEMVEDTVTIRTFVNGEEAAPLARAAASMLGTGLNFGAARNAASNRGFDGLLDEVAVWNRTLTVDEVLTAYRLGQNGKPVATTETLAPAPTVVSFQANPAESLLGEEVILSWEVTGSTEVWISGGIGEVQANGTEAVTAERGASYTLIALNGNSPVVSSLTLKVIEPPADLRDGLVVYYGFDSDLNNHPAASGPNATGLNDPTVGAPDGVAGNALRLSTTTNQHINSLVSFGGEGSDLGDEFTISAWYQLNEVPASNNSNRYFIFEGAENFPISFGLRDLGLGEPGFNDGQSFTIGANQPFADVGLAGWHQVVQRYTTNGGTTTIETFIDGIALGTLAGTTSNVSGIGINFGAPRSSVTDRGFDGLMDEIAIWSRPLTNEEIALSYELGRAGVGLLGSVADLVIIDLVYDAGAGVTTFDFVSAVGSIYAIDRSLDLEIWDEIEDNFQATEELSTFQDIGARPTAFYRVRRLK